MVMTPAEGSMFCRFERRIFEWRLTVDVTDIEDLANVSGHARIVGPGKLDLNSGPAQIGAHAKVSNGGDHGNGGRDVVEDAVGARLGKGHAHEDQGSHGHDGGDGEVPVGAMGGDMIVRRHGVGEAIDVEGVVTHPGGGRRA